MPEARVLVQYCKGCGLCVKACPRGILRMADTVDRRGIRVAVVRADVACIGCTNCAVMCPDAAIEVEK
jgi:2-oxoglutarate ferredoxin oxidoreductase subunit delta